MAVIPAVASRARHVDRGDEMRNLRNVRRVWAWRQGLMEKPQLEERELDVAACLLHRLPIATRAP